TSSAASALRRWKRPRTSSAACSRRSSAACSWLYLMRQPPRPWDVCEPCSSCGGNSENFGRTSGELRARDDARVLSLVHRHEVLVEELDEHLVDEEEVAVGPRMADRAALEPSALDPSGTKVVLTGPAIGVAALAHERISDAVERLRQWPEP